MKKAMLILLLPCSLLFSGCWDVQEMENTQYITAMGIDLESEDKILLSLHLVNTEQMKGSDQTGGSGNGDAYYLATAKGRDLYDAFRNFAKKHSRRGDLSHLQGIIIGEKFATDCMDYCLDWLNRNRQLRSTTSIFLAKGSAHDLMKVKPPQEKLAGDYLEGLTTVSSAVAMAPKVSIQALLIALVTQGKDAVLPRVEKVKLDPDGKGDKNETLQANGMGVFRGANFCGFISSQQTRGYFWLKGGFKDPIVLVLPNQGRWVSVESLKVASKIKPKVQGEKVSIEVQVIASGDIFEIRGPGSEINDSFFHQVGHLLGKEIEKEIKQTIIISQKLDSDFIGFGEIVRGSVSSKQWERINWRQLFSQVPIKVRVRANINRSGVALGQIMAW